MSSDCSWKCQWTGHSWWRWGACSREKGQHAQNNACQNLPGDNEYINIYIYIYIVQCKYAAYLCIHIHTHMLFTCHMKYVPDVVVLCFLAGIILSVGSTNQRRRYNREHGVSLAESVPTWYDVTLYRAWILLIGPLGINFGDILVKIHTFSFNKMQLKKSSAKLRPFSLGLSMFKMYAVKA